MAQEAAPTPLVEQAHISAFADLAVPRNERGGLFSALGSGEPLPAHYQDEYEQWCENMSPAARDNVAAKAHLLGRFAAFEASIDMLLGRMQAGEPVRQLGSGGKSYVMAMTVDDQEYAVRLVAPPSALEVPASQVSRYATNMHKAIGMRQTEQLQAICFTRPVTVSLVSPGENCATGLNTDTLQQITPSQLSDYLDTLKNVYRGMAVDQNPANTLYHPVHGFSCIDLGTPLFRSLASNVKHTLSFLFGQTLPEAPADEYDDRAHVIDELRRLVRAHFTQEQASEIETTLRETQQQVLQAAQDIRRRGHTDSGVHYYAKARAEAEREHAATRPSLEQWLSAYAIRLNTVHTESDVAGIRQQLENAQALMLEAGSSINTALLQWAITNLETAMRGTNSQFLHDALRQLTIATERATNAHTALQAANGHTNAYMRNVCGE